MSRAHPLVHRARPRAFTLPEVLATMVLLGIVLPVALHGVSMAMNVAASSRERAEAAAYAHTRLQEEVLGIAPDVDDADGMRASSPAFNHTITTASASDGLAEWTIEVTWDGRAGQQRYRLSTWVASDVSQALDTSEVLP